ncbi:glycosyltransferase [Deltaproteobacteria bacterium TL4]
MNETKTQYSGQSIAFLIPTKDRPENMKNLLDSLAIQTVKCGRVIVVASGISIEKLVMSYENCLPIEYHYCEPPGQIRQRNLGISLLDDRTPLVACIDDDIILESDALSNMISFWNQVEPQTAGIAFNITNEPGNHYIWWKELLLRSAREPGKVLKSGVTTLLANVKQNVRTDWLNGGTTVWKQSILKTVHHQAVNTRWAIYEDVIFSYPIGKHYPLYVCADARVKHDHPQKYWGRFYGRTFVVWRLYFVASHKELSNIQGVWAFANEMIIRTLVLFRFKKGNLDYTIGELQGLYIWMKAMLLSKDPRILNEE